MAFSMVPSDHITGINVNGTDLVIPLSNLTGLTAAEVDDSTGDVRRVLYELADMIYRVTNATAWKDETDKPANLVAYRNTSTDDTSDPAVVTRSYGVTAILTPTFEVADEA